MSNICELINVNKSYAKNVVLNNINMTVSKGEMVAITGKSGSGKTTILNIIGLLEKPDSGIVKIFDEEIPRIGSVKANKLLRTRISYLFQNYALIDNSTVNYNLEIPLIYSNKTKKVKQQMKIVALEKVGLNISLNQKIYELSGGEQQKIALARILLKPCDLILADEPTGSLDSHNRNEIMRILKELNNTGKTIIIVTHDPYVASICDRTINLVHKQIV
ncbi:ABC transporter ATP-binding protein [Tepidibacter thalassicus]|uniref:Putative ABC transport system ATP-binding protein n=1 Tax=Tepidibacter thalassicus DSM 15285 TaxID=1123350 RepID=A0A1M5S0P2_9FIRM|nr:ABC transporter ATP-binding protein [Tepidibacter thalassicus]SHH31898.1 putative ABC transport system ATP-binding protein [Tepidibacter thalassicus DSM 15285]